MTNFPALQPVLRNPTQPTLRASDTDRERAVDRLRVHCAEGRIAPDELAERLERAYRARDIGDLQALFDDLPTGTSANIAEPRRASAARLSRAPIAVTIVAAVATLAVVTDVHLLWFAWPLLAFFRLHNRPRLGRRSLAAGR
jgi:Domain of unknown function (DUF1707)